MRDLLIRCSSLGKIMTSPTAASLKAGEILSVGAKTYIRELAAQEILGITFEVSSKPMEKGNACEGDGIELLNRVRGLSLTKNTQHRKNGSIMGSCDLYDAPRRRGHDIKCAWSAATFPMFEADAKDSLYEWQALGYMVLWDADEWEVNYCLLDTPEALMRYEPLQMHIVSHIPEHHRLTTWTIKRDAEKEALMVEKVRAAREYMAQCIAEFDRRTAAQTLQLQPA
jgi:hypothetical protein